MFCCRRRVVCFFNFCVAYRGTIVIHVRNACTNKKETQLHAQTGVKSLRFLFFQHTADEQTRHAHKHTHHAKKKHCARRANMHTPKHATRNYTTQFLHKLYVLCCVVCPRVCFACVLVMSVPCINTRPNTHRNVYVNFGRVSVQLLMVCVCVVRNVIIL